MDVWVFQLLGVSERSQAKVLALRHGRVDLIETSGEKHRPEYLHKPIELILIRPII
jgi:hypothetical protein